MLYTSQAFENEIYLVLPSNVLRTRSEAVKLLLKERNVIKYFSPNYNGAYISCLCEVFQFEYGGSI